jgi:hypothetical protein
MDVSAGIDGLELTILFHDLDRHFDIRTEEVEQSWTDDTTLGAVIDDMLSLGPNLSAGPITLMYPKRVARAEE